MSRWRLIVVGIVLIPSPAHVGAQTVRGLVLESITDRPLALSSLALLSQRGDTVATALTDDQGFFSLRAPEQGAFWLVVEALGYATTRVGPMDLESNGLRILNVQLEPEPLKIPGVDVETDLPAQREPYLDRQGFYDREALGFGHFLSAEGLERELIASLSVKDVLLRVPGVYSGNGGRPMMRATTGRFCEPMYFVDGIRLRGRNPDLILHRFDLEGVEVYRRSGEVPMEYLSSAQGCGVVLLWTKH